MQDNEPTGLWTDVIVDGDPIAGLISRPMDIKTNKDFISHEGGEVRFTIVYGNTPKPIFFEVEIPEPLRSPDLFTFVSKRGDIYITASTNTLVGIYKYDVTTKKFNQIHSEGFGYVNFFETKDGRIFISSNNATNPGILVIRNNNVSASFQTGINYRWFESRHGDVFAASTGILVLAGNDTFIPTNITAHTDYRWHESTFGEVFVTGNAGGIQVWRGDRFHQVSVEPRAHAAFMNREFDGTTFVTSTVEVTTAAVQGIWSIQSFANEAVRFRTTERRFFKNVNDDEYYLELPDGTIFMSGEQVDTGVWRLDVTNNTMTRLMTTGSHYHFIQMPDGSVLFSSSLTTINGIWRIDPTDNSIRQVFGIGNNWTRGVMGDYNHSIHDPVNGAVFISSIDTRFMSGGILQYKDGEISRVYHRGNGWHFTRSNGGFIFAVPSDPIVGEGMLMFDARQSLFIVRTEDLSGAAFGKFTVSNMADNPTTLWNNRTPISLENVYQTSINRARNRVSIAFTADRSRMLWGL